LYRKCPRVGDACTQGKGSLRLEKSKSRRTIEACLSRRVEMSKGGKKRFGLKLREQEERKGLFKCTRK